jgi:hypothetical protein
MGAGASTTVCDELKTASSNDVRAVCAGFSQDVRQKLRAAIDAAEAEQKSSAEKRAATKVDTSPSLRGGDDAPSTFRVVSIADLGRCLVAKRVITPGEVVISEPPLLTSAEGAVTAGEAEAYAALLKMPNDVPEASRIVAILRAYCDAPTSVREAVLDSLSTIEYDASSAVTQSSREQAQAIREAHAWATGHSIESLTSVLTTFKLNAYPSGVGDAGSALFPMIRLIQHSCDSNCVFAPSPSDQRAGRGVVIATRGIAEGEPLTISYHDCTTARRMRRRNLQIKKEFMCRCTRCLAPDWNSQVPCPGCHPRDPNGRLPQDDRCLFSLQAHLGGARGVHYARRDGAKDGDEDLTGPAASRATEPWRCIHCSRVWTSADVFPSGDEIEERLENLVTALELRLGCSLEGDSDPTLLVDADAAIFEVALATTRTALGMRHWATIKLLCLQSLWICAQLSFATERPPGLPDLATCLRTLRTNNGWIWHFCAASGTQPSLFASVGRITLSALAALDEGEDLEGSQLTARCAAVVVAGDIHGLPAQWKADGGDGQVDPHTVRLLKSLDQPPTCAGAATVLRSAGESELNAGAAGSALLFFRRAHLYDPRSAEISARIEAATAAMALSQSVIVATTDTHTATP